MGARFRWRRLAGFNEARSGVESKSYDDLVETPAGLSVVQPTIALLKGPAGAARRRDPRMARKTVFACR
jgi:hypothetical protein